MILAGDIGGTKTLVGLFDAHRRRPVRLDVRAYATTDYPDLATILSEFLDAQPARPRIASAAFGVAGPVIDQHAEMTNVPWHVDAADLDRHFGVPHLRLLNDLEAMAHALPVLTAEEFVTLQHGRPDETGNLALIAAGTGLGQAVLHRVRGGAYPVASEGGHADFAARSDRELALVPMLRDRFGRAELEHVVSGPGLLNLSDFTHGQIACRATESGAAPQDPADVSTAALAEQCPGCVEALDLFVAAYGAAAGNLALTAVTTGGVFIGGGIAPQILPALQRGSFLAAFTAKGPMRALLEAMPVQVIMNAEAGLLGAAVFANAAV